MTATPRTRRPLPRCTRDCPCIRYPERRAKLHPPTRPVYKGWWRIGTAWCATTNPNGWEYPDAPGDVVTVIPVVPEGHLTIPRSAVDWRAADDWRDIGASYSDNVRRLRTAIADALDAQATP